MTTQQITSNVNALSVDLFRCMAHSASFRHMDLDTVDTIARCTVAAR